MTAMIGRRLRARYLAAILILLASPAAWGQGSITGNGGNGVSGNTGGGSSASVTDGTTTVTSPNTITFSGATVTNPTPGKATVTIVSGAGSVTNVSGATANGLTVSVANPSTTPTITVGTGLTGLVKGTGTAFTQATAGTDYLTPTGSGTGLSGILPLSGGTLTGALNMTAGLSIQWGGSSVISSGTSIGGGTLGNGPSFMAGLNAGNSNTLSGSWVVGVGFGVLHNYGGGGETACGGALACAYMASGGATVWGMHALGEEGNGGGGGGSDVINGNDAARNTNGAVGDVASGASSLRNGTPLSSVAIGQQAIFGNSAGIGVSGPVAPGDHVNIVLASTNSNVTNVPYTISVTATGSTPASLATQIAAAITGASPSALPQDAYVYLQANTVTPAGNPISNIVQLDFGGTPAAGWALSITPTVTVGSETITVYNGSVVTGFTATGYQSLLCIYCQTIANMTAYGAETMPFLQTGAGGTALGANSGFNEQTGSNFLYAGVYSGFTCADCTASVLVGPYAGYFSTADANTILGAYDTTAARNCSPSTGHNNMQLGYDSCVPSPTANGQLSVANAVYGLGNTGTATTVSTGCIGIYNTACVAMLDVLGKDTSAGTLAFRVQNSTPANMFSVSDSGVVLIGSNNAGFLVGSVTSGNCLQASGTAGGFADSGSTCGGGSGGPLGVADNSTPTPASGGTGNAVGDVLTLADGCSTHAKLSVVAVTTGAVTAYNITTRGSCSSAPSNPVAVTSTTGSGSGATFTLGWAPIASVILTGQASGTDNLYLNGNNGVQSTYYGQRGTSFGVGAAANFTGAANDNTAVGALACGGSASATFTSSSITCVGSQAAKVLKGSALSNIDAVGAASLTAMSTGSSNISGFGAGTFINLVSSATPANLAAVGPLACAGASGATFSNGICAGAKTGGALTSASKFVIIGPSVGNTTFASGANVILIGTSQATVDTPAANTSNYMNINNILITTGMQTPSTSVTNLAGTLTLGTSGTSAGTVGFNNATSGTVTVQPPTGALGSAVLTLPDVTDTIAVAGNVSQAFNCAVPLATAVGGSTLSCFMKASRSFTVDNITATAVGTLVTVTPTLFECGTSTTCATPTTIGSGAVTAANTATPITVSSASVTAGDYIAVELTAGTITSVAVNVSAEMH